MPGSAAQDLLDKTAGSLTVGLLGAIKHTDRRRMANFAGAFMRKIGPLFKEHRIGREQLRAAFPEKSDAEIEKILGGVWDNLGRIAIEFAHLDEFCVEGFGKQTADVITYPPQSQERYDRIMKSGKATIGFAAHFANWELPGVGAKLIGVKSAVLYRRPNIDAVSDVIVKLREPLMGELIPTGLDAPVKLARLLQSGVHVGMLADQHYSKGVEVTFFGRRMPCQSADRDAGAANGTADLRHARRAQTRRQQFLGRDFRAGRAGARCRRPRRHQGHHASRHVGDRRLDSPISRAMAVAAPPLAVNGGPNSYCKATSTIE